MLINVVSHAKGMSLQIGETFDIESVEFRAPEILFVAFYSGRG